MSSEVEKKNEGTDVYSILRDDIICLRLRPGTFFSIKDICEIYGVGRSPGRDALIRLAQEGLVTFLPQRGTMISTLDLERIDNERFIRRSIEENIMRDFVAIFSPSVILELEECIRDQKECLKEKDARRFFALDDQFHRVFYKETDRLYCADVVEKECGNYKRLRLLSLMVEEKAMSNAVEEHEAMVSTLSARESLDRLMFWFSLHLDRIQTQERTIVKRFPELFSNGTVQDRRDNSDLRKDFLLSIRSRG